MRTQHKKTTKNRSYARNLQYLEDHFRLFDLLAEQKKIDGCSDGGDGRSDLSEKIRRQLATIDRRLHDSQRRRQPLGLEQLAKRYHLVRMEKEILLFLLYRYFSLFSQTTSGQTIFENITQNRQELMHCHSYLLEEGRLRSNRLVVCHEEGEDGNLLESEFAIPEPIVCQILGEKPLSAEAVEEPCESDEKNYPNYLELYFALVQVLEKKTRLSMSVQDVETDWFAEPIRHGDPVNTQARQQIERLQQQLASFGAEAASYPLEQVTQEYGLSEQEKWIIVKLLHDSLVGMSDMFLGYPGKKLLALVSADKNDMIANRRLFYKSGKLRSNDLIYIEKEWSGQNILDAEYFLAEKVIRRVLDHSGAEEEEGEEDCACSGKSKGGQVNVLFTSEPRFTFADVVLPETQKKSIEIALSQQVHHDLIFNTWGFAKNIPYGNALTMLFSGPPGTGKTMMAEAIAHSLGKKLAIANYAQIQNLYVGETEKRIVAAFRKAQQENSVLLWDEADAMFYSRDMAQTSWECRDVNIILQEIERFHGVVILTTNRKVSLDHALERRLSLKVDFGMPDIDHREQIWKRLLPAEAPLSGDVDCRMLAEKYAVSGGTIKNAILHAARHAAYRGSCQIAMNDFLLGLELEQEGGWTKSHDKIGFAR